MPLASMVTQKDSVPVAELRGLPDGYPQCHNALHICPGRWFFHRPIFSNSLRPAGCSFRILLFRRMAALVSGFNHINAAAGGASVVFVEGFDVVKANKVMLAGWEAMYGKLIIREQRETLGKQEHTVANDIDHSGVIANPGIGEERGRPVADRQDPGLQPRGPDRGRLLRLHVRLRGLW